MKAARHLVAILFLPFVATAIIPYLLRTNFGANDTSWSDLPSLRWLGSFSGAVFFLAGFALFVWCLGLFARVGQGTLAPWDPTRKLVAVGPYAYVRNPMITSVLTMLLGEALFLGSTVVAGWALVFFAINHAYFILSEEAGLEHRFGESYREYKNRVPRWIPRLR